MLKCPTSVPTTLSVNGLCDVDLPARQEYSSSFAPAEVLTPSTVYKLLTQIHHQQTLCKKSAMDIARLLSGHTVSTPVRQSPELTVIKSIVRQLLFMSQQEVLTADKLPSHIHLTYLLDLSDGSKGIFKCSPRLGARLLRNEQNMLENESRALYLLNRRTALPTPRRIKFGSSGHGLALQPPFLLRSYLPGTPLSQLASRLTLSDKLAIDRALGAHYATLSCQTASSFGSLHAVHSGSGIPTWRQTFLSLLEATLRDAEDILVSVPYDNIRHSVTIHSEALDALPRPEPRLTALSFCAADKVLIDEATMQISGLIGLDNVLWGDPEFAPIFQDPTPSFLEGYGSENVLDDDNRARRMLLYRTYHCMVTIVQAQYRPGSDADELLARRQLADSLNSLVDTLEPW